MQMIAHCAIRSGHRPPTSKVILLGRMCVASRLSLNRQPLVIDVNDPIDTVGEKVAAIFAELVGERAKRLDGSVIAEPAMSVMGGALAEQYGEKANDIAFHMADWNFDAAFIV